MGIIEEAQYGNTGGERDVGRWKPAGIGDAEQAAVGANQARRSVKCTISAGALTRSGNQLPVPLPTISAPAAF